MVGYMRVSTDGDREVMDLQRRRAASVRSRASGSRDDRAGLAKALVFLTPGRLLCGVEARAKLLLAKFLAPAPHKPVKPPRVSFRIGSAPLIRQAFSDAKSRCDCRTLGPAQLARDNPVYHVETQAEGRRRSRRLSSSHCQLRAIRLGAASLVFLRVSVKTPSSSCALIFC